MRDIWRKQVLRLERAQEVSAFAVRLLVREDSQCESSALANLDFTGRLMVEIKHAAWMKTERAG